MVLRLSLVNCPEALLPIPRGFDLGTGEVTEDDGFEDFVLRSESDPISDDNCVCEAMCPLAATSNGPDPGTGDTAVCEAWCPLEATSDGSDPSTGDTAVSEALCPLEATSEGCDPGTGIQPSLRSCKHGEHTSKVTFVTSLSEAWCTLEATSDCCDPAPGDFGAPWEATNKATRRNNMSGI